MSATAADPELAQQTAALCFLLDAEREVRDMPQVLETAERAKALLVSGAGRDALRGAFDAVDDALRRAGEARGLLGHARGLAPQVQAPGVRSVIKVAVCPGPLRCTRRERARDLLPAPACAVSGGRMVKERLRPGP